MTGQKVLLLFLGLLVVALAKIGRPMDPVRFQQNVKALGDFKWTTAFYKNMPVDHFAASNDATFSLKYLYNLDYYKTGGPLFFYTGNEGTIEGFALNTGMMWDLADHFNAAIIFAEHRYYGDSSSIPFSTNASALSVAQLNFLTSEQALADFATLIPYLKTNLVKCPADTPVIAFGGSYGGMLSAWFRMKYPHVVDGAWAASAPLLYFHNGGVAPGAFEHIVKETYKTSGCNVDLFSRGWELITNMSKSAEGCKKLNTIFHIDPKTPIRNSSDADSLIEYIQNGIDYMAMTDYPYPSSFLTSMPGWPVEAACKGLQGKKTDNEILQGIFQAAMVYYNSSKTNPIQSVCLRNCESSATSSLGSFDGWDWQECTEILIEMCSTGPPNDFYSNTCTNGSFNVASFADSCVKEFGKDFKKDYVKVDKVARLYGLNMRAHSRIIFTGGELDPWNSGSITEKSPGMEGATERELYVFQIGGSAHHLDLREPNTCDPDSVVFARYQIVNILFCWAYPKDPQCQNSFQQQKLPDFVKKNVTCAPQPHKYPWGFKTNLRPSIPVATTTHVPTTTKSTMGTFQSTFLVAVLALLALFMD